MELPELGGEEAAEVVADASAAQTCAEEVRCEVRQMGGPEAGKKTKGEIQDAPQKTCREAQRPGRREAEL